MTMLRERAELLKSEAEKAQKHNDSINENFEKIKNLVHAQFDEEEIEDVATEEVVDVVEEAPLYISPANVTKLEQAPLVTEYAAPTMETTVATQTYEMPQSNVEMVTPPVQEMERATQTVYSLTPLAKVVMAAFTCVAIAMLSLIAMNTQIIRQKKMRIQNLEEKKQQLVEKSQEVQRRIEAAQSEEAIRQYALENGIVLGN